MKILQNNSPLSAIVCGFERGGTTLISEILRQHPTLDSGFECGFLLSDNSPLEFLTSPIMRPYREMINDGWRVTDADVKYICESDTWAMVYSRIIERSGNFNKNKSLLFDKTPIYMKYLSSVLEKVPNVPCIVIVREPLSLFWAWEKRMSKLTENINIPILQRIPTYIQRYSTYINGLKLAMLSGYADRIYIIKYEKFCMDIENEATKMFEFLNLDYSPDYLKFAAPKFPNVYGNDISTIYIDEYKHHLDDDTCNKIIELTNGIKYE